MSVYINKELVNSLNIPNKIQEEFNLTHYVEDRISKVPQKYGACARFDDSKFNSIYFLVYSKKINDEVMLKFSYKDNNFEFNSIYVMWDRSSIKENRYDSDMNLLYTYLHIPDGNTMNRKINYSSLNDGKFLVVKKTRDGEVISTGHIVIKDGKRDKKKFVNEIDYLEKNNIASTNRYDELDYMIGEDFNVLYIFLN